METTQEEFDEQHRFLIAVRDEITSTHETVLSLRERRSQLEEQIESGLLGEDAQSDAERVAQELLIIEEQLIQFRARATQDLINYPVRLNDKLSTLFTLVEMADSPPTAQDYELFEDLKARIQALVSQLETVAVTTERTQFRMPIS